MSDGAVGGRCYSQQWPDADSFNAFFNEAQPDIGPVMQAAGVTSPPEATFRRTLDAGDAVGWA